LPREVIKEVKESGLSWEQFLLKECEKLPAVRELLEPAQLIKDSVRVVRDYSYRCNQVSGPGFFLVGDAAGFIDPIFSVGVVLGMYSARAATWSIEGCFRMPARTARYQAIFTDQLQARMELARNLALPQYQLAGPASAQAKNAAQFMHSQARALMLDASSLVARSQHVLALLDEPAAADSPALPE
jgi:flavin-dependent dehydrogenase